MGSQAGGAVMGRSCNVKLEVETIGNEVKLTFTTKYLISFLPVQNKMSS
jgi:hypothetical protein